VTVETALQAKESQPSELDNEEKRLPLEIVAPLDIDRLAVAFKKFQEFKARLLTKDDSVDIKGKQYLKKSAWRKWALACGVSDEILSHERIPPQGKDHEGNFFYRLIVRAYHNTTGRSSIGVAVASRNEKEAWTHEEHDIFSLAHTRAKNRAIADLVGGGEVSAEEMVAEETSTEPRKRVEEAKVTEKEDGADARPFKVPLTKDQVSSELAKQGVKQYPLLKGLQSFGMINILGEEAAIIPERPLPVNTALIEGFLLRKVLDPMKTKHGFTYRLNLDPNGFLTAIVIRGRLEEQQVKEILSATTWAFQRALTLETE